MEGQRLLAVVQTDLQLICSMRDAIEESGLGRLSIARNSQEAILYLRGVGIYGDRQKYPLPSIVLLDCANPDSTDLEVLGWLREEENFDDTPVIMLCGPEHDEMRVACALDQSCFLVERTNYTELVDAIGALEAARIYSAATA
jgi:DNA-binding response OmpR family regulator